MGLDGIDRVERIRAMRLRVPPIQSGTPTAYPTFTQFAAGDPDRVFLWVYNGGNDQVFLSPTPDQSFLHEVVLWPDEEVTFSLDEDPDIVRGPWFWATRSGAVGVWWREWAVV